MRFSARSDLAARRSDRWAQWISNGARRPRKSIEPKSRPGRPGRRSGDDHGKHGHREPPGEVDEELDAPLIGRCERGGEIEEERGELQYQDELTNGGRSAAGFECMSASAVAASAGIRDVTRSRPRMRWGRRGGCSARVGGACDRDEQGLGLSLHKTAKAPARLGIRVTAGGVVQAIASGPGA